MVSLLLNLSQVDRSEKIYPFKDIAIFRDGPMPCPDSRYHLPLEAVGSRPILSQIFISAECVPLESDLEIKICFLVYIFVNTSNTDSEPFIWRYRFLVQQ